MRILVFGNSGSGKSTFARRLAGQHGLALLDLDDIVWSRTEFATFRPDTEIAAAVDLIARLTESWVIEGC